MKDSASSCRLGCSSPNESGSPYEAGAASMPPLLSAGSGVPGSAWVPIPRQATGRHRDSARDHSFHRTDLCRRRSRRFSSPLSRTPWVRQTGRRGIELPSGAPSSQRSLLPPLPLTPPRAVSGHFEFQRAPVSEPLRLARGPEGMGADFVGMANAYDLHECVKSELNQSAKWRRDRPEVLGGGGGPRGLRKVGP